MNKKQMINEIIELYDENEALKAKVSELSAPKEFKKVEAVIPNPIIELEKKAKKLLFNEIFYSWHSFDNETIEVTEDSGEFNFLSYEQWIKKIGIISKLNSSYNYLLDTISVNEIKQYFDEEFKEYYQSKVDKKKMEIVRSKKEGNE